MTSRQVRGLPFLLLFFSLSGCSTIAKQDTAAIAPEPVTTTPPPEIVPAPPPEDNEGTVTAIILVDQPSIAEIEMPVLSEQFKETPKVHKKKKAKKRNNQRAAR